MKLSDREWGEFKIADILSNSINAKAYHSNSLVKTKLKGIAYITRTNLFNGLQCIVESNQNFKENPLNTIVFGAENATYFYQPFKYITGNKMYYYNTSKLSQEVNLFITCCLNLSLKGCGFGFGMGLTGTRSDSRKFLLPINDNGEPDYKFMGEYIKEMINKKRQKYIEYVKDKMKSLKVVGGGNH